MRALMIGTLALATSCGGSNTRPQGEGRAAPGADRTAKTSVLESGANLLQSKAPVEQISMYLNGFHVSKDDPSMVMESDHYCNQVNQDFAQCVLFDGNGKDARLHGIEYIISANLYDNLPAEEKMYWHPHNYEVLSGELVMPGLPEAVETQALKDKINSYGKAWHVWKTGVHGEQPDPLPYGPPHLAWSFNHDGEVPAELLQSRDARLSTNTEQRRQSRADLASLARPQGGVEALAGKLPSAKGAPAGVSDDGDPNARPVPTFGIKAPQPKPKPQ
jgi:hypothetical protein